MQEPVTKNQTLTMKGSSTREGVFEENGEIDEIPNMFVFTKSGHQNDEIDENTLELATRRAPPH